MLYPLKFEPVYKSYFWGGRNLEKLGRMLPDGKIAESWEVACNFEGISIIANGAYKGLPLSQLLALFGENVLGKGTAKFPLLIKLLDANDRLSVQVHPDDRYARTVENQDYGKSEMWYVLAAQPGAKIVYNLREGVIGRDLDRLVKTKEIERWFNYVDVSAGDAIYIPAGTIHGLGEGIIVVEIQQNSTTTYRIYDYDRTDASGAKRPLHIEKASEVANFNRQDETGKVAGLVVACGHGSRKTYLVAERHFAVELYDVAGSVEEVADGSKFYVFTIIEGAGEVRYGSGQTVSVCAVETVMIPAALGRYCLAGRFKALKAYVPDLTADVVTPLKAAGYSSTEIFRCVGGLADFIHINTYSKNSCRLCSS
ncbi:mannose-6-phosphate isomerase, class I [Thermosinus carboxydivorans Nor1]|uniref:Phosphohexomutase n=1 Tax=Thermosinus carboxydivorans Nor1 TaxID=401526 RepID=A1HSH6_9FIRM|nr:type I phosphomannose isomerase catalytic subunit [Thermosinus carboxydivorans]EAX47040.1 mannose-6-phosphate isomerase, class I [Thermosinus carboxydivorans Nor1]